MPVSVVRFKNFMLAVGIFSLLAACNIGQEQRQPTQEKPSAAENPYASPTNAGGEVPLATVTPTVKPARDSILGSWEGIVTGGSEAASAIRLRKVRIAGDCQSLIDTQLCVEFFWEETVSEYYGFDGEQEGLYCFWRPINLTNYPEAFENMFCFEPLPGGTLKYTGEGALWGEEGILHRVEKFSRVAQTQVIGVASAAESKIILQDGSECRPLGRATWAFLRKDQVNYSCANGWFILGEPDQATPVWTIRKANFSQDLRTILKEKRVGIRTIWYWEK